MKYTFPILLVSSVIILQACGGNSEGQNNRNSRAGQNKQATSVETIEVTQQDIARQIHSFGTVRAKELVQVTPQVSNRITRIYADLGDTVSQGERLAKIYDATYQDQVQQARSQLEQSRASFERDSAQFSRQQQLYERDLISASELGEARATFQSSKAQLQSSRAGLTESRENLQNTVIRSPVYGVVVSRNVAQGDLASSGQVAFEIGNLTGFETSVYLPLQEWENVNIGQKVNFQLSNRRESSAEGRVSRISPRLDPTTGLGKVIITFTQKGPSIYQGALVESIISVETDSNTVVIPRAALVENVQTLIEPESNTIQTTRSYSAFVVQDDSLALKGELTLGIEQGDQVQITSGLQPGDEVVITGQASLEDSSWVQVAQGDGFRDRSVPIGSGPNDESSSDAPSSNTAADTSSSNSNNN